MIDDAASVPSINEVGISGGEPFLFPDLLQSVVAYAGTKGYTSSVTTNGFWGRSPAMRDRLVSLNEVGLRALCISSSIFHQEFLAPDRLRAAVRSALGAGLAVTVNVVETADFGRPQIDEVLSEFAGSYAIVAMPLLPAGRGATDAHAEEFGDRIALPVGSCRRHFSKLAIDRAGDAYPCCSPGGFTPPLRLGNVQKDGLSAIVAASGESRLLAILEEVGPAFFLPFLRAANDTALPEQFSDQCHLCHVMLSTPSLRRVVRDATDKLFAEVDQMGQRFESLS